MKKTALIAWLVLLFAAISYLFWHNEWKYSLPTPVPVNYQPVAQGSIVSINSHDNTNPEKPVFFHFFNPDCPCSRFNTNQFKSLVKQYGDRIQFKVVAMCSNSYTVEDIQDKFDLKLPVLFDSSIAASCGVYSTPQAALIGTDGRLYYRGNYNKSRYCTDKKSNYAEIAIIALLDNNHNPAFEPAALKSYGCTLPQCSK